MAELNFGWERPLVIDAELLQPIDNLLDTFVAEAIEAVVASAGENPARLKSSSQVLAKADRIKTLAHRSKLRNLAREIDRIESKVWTVKFRDGMSSDMPLTDILNLPNTGEASISEVSVRVGRYGDHHIDLTFENQIFSNSASIRLSSSPEMIRRFTSQIRERLRAASESWWILRSAKALAIGAVLAAVILAVLGVVLSAIEGSADRAVPDSQDSESPGWILISVAAVSALVAPAGWVFVKCWAWLFPKAFFTIGHGAREYRFRAGWRRTLFWTVPVLGLGLPLVTSVLERLL